MMDAFATGVMLGMAIGLCAGILVGWLMSRNNGNAPQRTRLRPVQIRVGGERLTRGVPSERGK
jgi:hypothetical protein